MGCRKPARGEVPKPAKTGEIQTGVNKVRRSHSFAREKIRGFWTPGVASPQIGYSRELAASLLFEADEFYNRALASFLLRHRFRECYASTWANIALYYSNYFSAMSFCRLHLQSITHTQAAGTFSIRATNPKNLIFSVAPKVGKFSHTEAWEHYYSLVSAMGWPDHATASRLAPTATANRFREQRFRERTNYRPGDGFLEVSAGDREYRQKLLAAPSEDADYNESMAAARIEHLGTLFRALRTSRADADSERESITVRRALIARYASKQKDRQFAQSVIQ